MGYLASCNTKSNDPAEILKQRINNAKMVEYVDTFYGAKLLYPDFFKIDSIGNYYASFSYTDSNVKELNLYYKIWPPRMEENPKEVARSLTDSFNTFLNVKSCSYIMIQEYENFPEIKCVFKNYKTQHGWTSYVLTYEKQYEEAVERLIKMTKDWKVYDKNTPEWFTDMCDFFDF